MTGATDPGGSADRAARVVLTWLAEPGNRAVWTLVRDVGAPEALDRILRGAGPVPATALARLGDVDPQRLAGTTLDRAERLGARIVVPADDEWPGRVDDLGLLETDAPGQVNQDVRPPLCLWVRGGWALDQALERSVAVVGARAATSYGVQVTTEIAYGVARQGWTVVSGGAFGVDAAAHRGAMAAEGLTVAVLACGLDRPYPVGNAAMFEQIADTGLLVSEWPPGAEPLRHRFLIRNRVIAAATTGTVVIEAAARSGAAQTMSRVFALGRRAMAVPGPVTSAMSVGCHEILRSRPEAVLVTGPEQVLETIGRMGEFYTERPRGPQRPNDFLDEETARLLEVVPRRGTVSPEDLAVRAGLSLRTVLRRLSLLELTGLVVRRADGIALPRRGPTGPS